MKICRSITLATTTTIIIISIIITTESLSPTPPPNNNNNNNNYNNNTDIIPKACNHHYCYQIIKPNATSVYRRYHPTWKNVTDLESFCPNNISPDSWMLEIYDDDEQKFVEAFLRNNSEAKNSFRWAFPLIVPLNLKVSYMDGWYWLNGGEADNINTNISGNHYAYMDINGSDINYIATSSNLPDHHAMCHINKRHCKELKSSFLFNNEYCIYQIKRRLTWHEARMVCHQKKGELTSITPEHERNFFRNRYPRRSISFQSQLKRRLTLERPLTYIAPYWKDIWVGLKNIDEVWLKKNRSAIYTNWGGDAIHPFKFGYEFAFLETDSGKWSVAVPEAFQMKVVCMTDNNIPETSKEETTTIISTTNDQCRVTITWLVTTMIILLIVALLIGILLARDKFRSGIPLRTNQRRADDCAILRPFDELHFQRHEDGLDAINYRNGLTPIIN